MSVGEPVRIFTVGHSTAGLDELRRLLRMHAITILADVRSRPYNPFLPQFNRDRMKMVLLEDGIVYAFLGDRLGRVPGGPTFARRREIDLVRVEESADFRAGIDWLEGEARRARVCIFCGEAAPEPCHRDYLIGQNLIRRGVRVVHILPDGELREAAPDLFHLPEGSDGNHTSG